MRLLIVHPEARFFAGAEKMLGHFLTGLLAADHQVTLAVAPGSRTAGVVPAGCAVVPVPENGRFSLITLGRTLAILRRAHAQTPFAVVHGWGSRDWELAGLAGRLLGRPALGTLHDHPLASFITGSRRRLMRLAARRGLQRVVCVSEAVRLACVAAGYPVERLAVVRNGLPPAAPLQRSWRTAGRLRLGFLGAFSERKGLRGFFAALAMFAARTSQPWELHLAGEAQDAGGHKMLADLRRQHAAEPWWPQVHWHGWMDTPARLLGLVDVLVVPSSEFDPFPTVLLEAGQAGVPVLAARVGGVAEIIVPGETGWLFEPGDWSGAAAKLEWLAGQSATEFARCGQLTFRRQATDFTLEKMSAQYGEIFSRLTTNG